MQSKSTLLASLAAVTVWAWAWATEPVAPPAEDPERVTLQGRVVEIHAELKETYGVDMEDQGPVVLGFKTPDGKIYTLLKTRRSAALFTDPRLRERELIIQGRQFPKTEIVEATFLQSIHDGVVHDLYYYCEICSIKALTPEICACCREPVILVEETVKKARRP